MQHDHDFVFLIYYIPIYFTDFWKSDEEIQSKKPKQTKSTLTEPDSDDNFLGPSIITPRIELPELPILNITSSNVKLGATSTEWAEMIDVSQPVLEFRERLKYMAHTYPFELDNFQKQVY